MLFLKLTRRVYQLNLLCMKCPVKRRVNAQEKVTQDNFKGGALFFVRSYKYSWSYSIRSWIFDYTSDFYKIVVFTRSCWWNITWLDMYLAIPFLLSSCYLLHLSNQNESVYLFTFHIPTKFMINKEKKHFSVVICVRCINNAMLWNISFLGWHFPALCGL